MKDPKYQHGSSEAGWMEQNDTPNNEVARLRDAARAVVDRWETPLWKDAEPTASVIYRLRDALAPTEPATEWRELGPDEVIQEGEQERIPPRLDAEIEVIDDPSTYSAVEARHATADAIRYLRNEIEKLKKNQK
jgi:hypothetical protein